MLSADSCLALYHQRQKYYADFHDAMAEIDLIYSNKAKVPLPDAGKDSDPAVPNLLAQGVDQLAGRISSVIPNVIFSAERQSRAAERRAKTAARTVTAWWQADKLPLKMRRRARHLIAYGMTPVSIRYSTKEQRPTWKLRDPRCTFPSVETYGDHFTPENVLFAYKRNISWLVHRGYADQITAVTGLSIAELSKNGTSDAEMLLLEYVDEYGTCLYLTGWTDPMRQNNMLPNDHRTHAPPTLELMGGHNAQRCVELEQIVLPKEMMLATVPTRIALNGPSSQFESMVSTFYTHARLAALEILAVEKGIFPDTYLVGRPGEQPKFEHGPVDGRTGDVNIVTGGVIQTETYAPGYMTDPIINRLERSERLNAGVPAEFGGESGDNIRTARRGDTVLSGVIDHPIAEAQEVLQAALAEENKAAIALAKQFDGTAPRSIFVNIGNDTRKVDYISTQVFEHDEHVVAYPMTGTDVNTMLMTNGQRVGLGVMSKRAHMEMDPAIPNAELEHDRIIAEGLEQGIIGGIQQQLAAGAMPPIVGGRVMELVVQDKMELPGALRKATEEYLAEQAAQQAAQAPQGPPTADGAAAPAGVAALAGSPIPGPSEGQSSLRDLMATLRGPAMTIQPGRGMERGAV